MLDLIHDLKRESSEQRRRFIVEAFVGAYGDEMQRAPEAWQGKFRKMSSNPFAFYRGSAALFYSDVGRQADPFSDAQTSRVWIQGDLHAENFGTYMNSQGILVFDVNDFDESYIGPFTWDLGRLAASLALIGYQKALSDSDLREILATLAGSYSAHVARFARKERGADHSLTLDTTSGPLNEVICEARLRTRVGLLDRFTLIENYDRRFRRSRGAETIDSEARAQVEEAFARYVDTIPLAKRRRRSSYRIKDVVVRHGMGIGSAGLPSYSILLEGRTQALENDTLLFMKQAQPAAPSRVVEDPSIEDYFLHDGHRTAVSQRALQAYADPWLGYTSLNDVGQLVAEVAPYTHDLEWGEINHLPDILQVVGYLGEAVAKIHCVSDEDSDQDLVNFSTDQAIHASLAGREADFRHWLVEFGLGYGELARDDFTRFVDAFRNHAFPGL